MRPDSCRKSTRARARVAFDNESEKACVARRRHPRRRRQLVAGLRSAPWSVSSRAWAAEVRQTAALRFACRSATRNKSGGNMEIVDNCWHCGHASGVVRRAELPRESRAYHSIPTGRPQAKRHGAGLAQHFTARGACRSSPITAPAPAAPHRRLELSRVAALTTVIRSACPVARAFRRRSIRGSASIPEGFRASRFDGDIAEAFLAECQ